MYAKKILIIGVGLGFYILLYILFLVYLLLSTPKETKLVRKYGKKQNNKNRRKLYVVSVTGGMLCIMLIYLFVKFV